MSAVNAKRDCLFFVADKNIEAIVAGCLERPHAHTRLGCRAFQFNTSLDLKVAHGQNDCGIYKIANALLQPYASSHHRVVVILDSAWNGTPGANAIKQAVEAHCVNAGWLPNTSCAIVIDPELENWVWQDNAHVLRALSSELSYNKLRQELVSKLFWREGESKPHQPKEAVEFVLRQNRVPRSSALYKKLASQVSSDGCIDEAFLNLKTTLRTWFPPV